MSESHPPVAPAGEPLGGGPAPAQRSSRRGLAVVGAAVAVAVAGGGAYAAWNFLSTGAQPAEVLPASTLGYVAVDVDPGGAQKIEAFRTLRKFPALQEELGLDTDDDLRELIVDEFLSGSDCDLSFENDFAPWVGKKLAMAAVPGAGDDEVTPVIVVEVSDEEAATTGLTAVRECSDDLGWAFQDGFVLVSPTEAQAAAVADEVADGSTLADDEGFSTWVDEAGGGGFVTGYVAPTATPYLLDAFDGLSDLASLPGAALPGLGGPATPGITPENPFADMSDAELEAMGIDPDLVEELYGSDDGDAGGLGSGGLGGLPGAEELEERIGEEREQLEEALADFEGAGMSLRFDDGAARLEAVAGGLGNATDETPAVSDLVGSLPAATGVLIAMSVNGEWAESVTSTLTDLLGEGLVGDIERATGLDLPGDAQTLLGDAIALVIDGRFDAREFTNSFDPSTLPVGLRILGDPDEIGDVVEKLLSSLGADAQLVTVEKGDDGVAVGLDPAWVASLAEDGDIGDNDRYDDVVSGDGDPASVFFIDFDAPWFTSLSEALTGGDLPEVDENLEPLKALGISSWVDEDQSRLVLELATD